MKTWKDHSSNTRSKTFVLVFCDIIIPFRDSRGQQRVMSWILTSHTPIVTAGTMTSILHLYFPFAPLTYLTGLYFLFPIFRNVLHRCGPAHAPEWGGGLLGSSCPSPRVKIPIGAFWPFIGEVRMCLVNLFFSLLKLLSWHHTAACRIWSHICPHEHPSKLLSERRL